MHSDRSDTSANPPLDELRWVARAQRFLDEDIEEADDGIPVSIVKVPKALASTKPEAYTPQLVALGPYHHHHPELREMERYKLSAARRAQSRFHHGIRFHDVVNDFCRHDPRIRAHYHRYLDLNSETLAWMMAIDASFLLEFLQIHAHARDEKKTLLRLPSRITHLVDLVGRRPAHNLILRDVLMVENQVPLFLLKKLIDAQCSSTHMADGALSRMLLEFVDEVYPFAKPENLHCGVDVLQHPHLLDLLYGIIVPRSDSCECLEVEDHSDHSTPPGCPDRARAKGRTMLCCARRVFSVCWKVISSHPVIMVLKQPAEHLFFRAEEANSGPENSISRTSSLVEEIAIPSVTELVNAGTTFVPTNGGLSSISFDAETRTFHLPAISLDVNTEVLLRNLVAYEVSMVDGPWVITRYTELMNGIIDTGEDMRLLRESGVVLNHMKSDEEAARMWNGMSRSIKLTRVPSLDAVVEDVNAYYSSRWRVRVGKIMERNGLEPWHFPSFVILVLMLFLATLHSFCLFHHCEH